MSNKIREEPLGNPEQDTKILKIIQKNRQASKPKIEKSPMLYAFSLDERLRMAVIDREIVVTDTVLYRELWKGGIYHGEVPLLDGKPLESSDTEVQVRKAYKIQQEIKEYYLWDAQKIKTLRKDKQGNSVEVRILDYDIQYESGDTVNELLDMRFTCLKCYRFIDLAKTCPYCGKAR